MSKQKLAIFDLDDTLIRGDSFRTLILDNMFKRPKLSVLSALRITKILGRKQFAEHAHKTLLPLLDNEKFMLNFLKSLETRIYEEVLQIVHSKIKDGDKVVLISASPHQYVKIFAKQMGFTKGFGSNWRNGNYEHLYGKAKLDFALLSFPKDKFDWCYAISDSLSDSLLLDAFNEHEYWKGDS